MAGTGPCSGRGLEFGPEFCLPRLEAQQFQDTENAFGTGELIEALFVEVRVDVATRLFI